jgi:hypothetical protein
MTGIERRRSKEKRKKRRKGETQNEQPVREHHITWRSTECDPTTTLISHPHPTLYPPAEARGYTRMKETMAGVEEAGSNVNQAGGRSLRHTHEHKEPQTASHEKKRKEERGPEIRNQEKEKKQT